MAVPNIFGSATSAIPLSQLDQNFATAITLGNTAVYLGNTTTSLGNVTLTNVLISSTNGDATVNGLTVGRGNASVATNTAVGASALAANTIRTYNVAVGYQALQLADANYNTAIGGVAAASTTTGGDNVAVGTSTLTSNTTGSYNTALGRAALAANTTASNNTAVGYQAGYSNTGNNGNTYIGYQSGYTANNTVADAYNTFLGYKSGYGVTTGTFNTFIGSASVGAGSAVTTGSKNTIIGGYTGNTAALDIRTASNYIVLSDGDGNPRLYCDNNGVLYSPTTYSNTSASAANVGITTAAGIFFRSTSALKYKQNIRDLEEVDINKFRAVRYNSKCELDNQTQDHFGIIADEVHAAGITELVNYGADDEVEGFQYERLTVVLLKAMQTLKAEFDAYKEAHP
jgi:trimeric autotransporter adhesin